MLWRSFYHMSHRAEQVLKLLASGINMGWSTHQTKPYWFFHQHWCQKVQCSHVQVPFVWRSHAQIWQNKYDRSFPRQISEEVFYFFTKASKQICHPRQLNNAWKDKVMEEASNVVDSSAAQISLRANLNIVRLRLVLKRLEYLLIRSVFPNTFIMETMGLSNLPAFVVSAQNENPICIANLESNKKRDRFDWMITTTMDVIAGEEIFCFRLATSDSKEFH